MALFILAEPAFAEPRLTDWVDLVPREADQSSVKVPRWERVRTDLNNKDIRIPGFIVPVEFDGKVVKALAIFF